MKWIKDLARWILNKEIKDFNKRVSDHTDYLNKSYNDLEDAIADNDKAKLVYAMYGSAERNGKELHFNLLNDQKKVIYNEQGYAAFSVPVEVTVK